MDEIKPIGLFINILNSLSFSLMIYYTNFKIVNRKIEFTINEIIKIVIIILVSTFLGIIKYEVNYIVNILSLLIIISLLFSNSYIKNSILTTLISIGINYIINIFAIIFIYNLTYFVKIENDYLIFVLMRFISFITVFSIFKIKKLKYGFVICKYDEKNEYIDVLTLNISLIIIFLITIILNMKIQFVKNIVLILFCFGIIIFKTIQKSIELYYKQKLLIQDLKETKNELDDKKKEITILEEENLKISKKSHSLAHKQKVLEHKINKLLYKTEYGNEFDLKDKLKELSKEIYKDVESSYINKTGIIIIDDMLETMQEECQKTNIEFNIQICGNIFKMINYYVEKEDLEILLADHIKDAIIAVNHSDNTNRSILVKLGKIDECYGVYFYDSGVEFDEKVLDELGKRPVTAYANEGGTGMGFMNTFDTLKKYNASLIIKHLGKPSKENFTKIIMIKFDKNAKFCLTNES